MSIIPPNSPSPANPQNAPLAPSFEDQLREFWIKYSKPIMAAVVLLLLAVLAKGAYEYWQQQREKEIAATYNRATTNDQLRTFANENASHVLGGAAFLRLGDDAYSNGKYSDAVALYDKAAAALKEGPLGARAQLGSALCRILAGQASEGEQALNRIASDANQLKAVRAEAAYHLGTIAMDAGRKEDAAKFFDQASSIDPSSFWAQQAQLQKR